MFAADSGEDEADPSAAGRPAKRARWDSGPGPQGCASLRLQLLLAVPGHGSLLHGPCTRLPARALGEGAADLAPELP